MRNLLSSKNCNSPATLVATFMMASTIRGIVARGASSRTPSCFALAFHSPVHAITATRNGVTNDNHCGSLMLGTTAQQTRTLKMARFAVADRKSASSGAKTSALRMGSYDDDNDMSDSSWMDKNERFPAETAKNDSSSSNYDKNMDYNNHKIRDTMRRGMKGDDSSQKPSTFRENFRGTRVFVQGIPDHVSWQELKDHFKVAGNVVFASISVDRDTNKPKGHGIVQFETVDEADKAIKIIRDHPLDDGSALYVRADVQESNQGRAYGGGNAQSAMGSRYEQRQQRSLWKCANDSDDLLSKEELSKVVTIVKARDASRRRKNYEASDAMREQLKQEYSVHLDDRLKLWWKQVEGDVAPENLNKIKGEGHWKTPVEWRQIPSTPELDACVDPRLVQALLTQRDIARREKDFFTADTLLEQAKEAANSDGLTLRVHDESHTWRVWSEERPQRRVRQHDDSYRGSSSSNDPAEQCLKLVERYDPKKMEEVENLLKAFPGREYSILKKLKQRYLTENNDERIH